MNCIDNVAKFIRYKQKKQKISSLKNFATFAILGVAIGGVVAILFTENCFEEIRNMVISHGKAADADMDEDEDMNIKKEDIKETVKNADADSLGDVGIAMETALKDSNPN